MVAERLVRVKLLVEAPGATQAGNQAASALERTATSADKAEASLKKSGAAASVFKAAAGSFTAVKLVSFLNDSVNAASDLNETVSKSAQIFGTQATAVRTWSQDAAKNMGLSSAAALDAAANFGNMFQQLGYTSKAAADMSTKTVQMAADLGSFNNLPTADVADRIGAAFRGEYDSLQLLIPNISAARVEQQAMSDTGKTNAASLTAQEKAAAVLAIVHKDGATAMGDFARTADGYANSTKTATARIEEQQAALGQKLMPVWQGALSVFSNVVMPVLSGVADVLGVVAGAIQAIPGPVLAAGAALAAWKLLDGPVNGFLTTVRTKMAAISTEAPTMGAKAKLAGGALMGALGGPIGLAVTGLTLGIGLLAKKVEGTEIATHDFASAIDDLTGAIDRVKVQDVVKDDTLAKMQKAGVAAGDYTLALSGNEDAMKRVRAALEANIAAHEGDFDAQARAGALLNQYATDARGVVGALDNWSASQKEANSTVDKAPDPTKSAEDATKKLRDEYDKTAYSVSSVAGQVTILMQKLDEQAGRNGDAEAAQRAFNAATRDYAAAQRDIPAATREVEQAQSDLTAAEKDLTQAQREHGKGSAEAAQATRDLAGAQDRLAEAQAGQGAAADGAAEKSENLRKNYLTLGQTAYDQAMAQGNLAGATDAAAKAMQTAKDAWIAAQPQADILSGKAQTMAEKLFGIPTQVATTITATDNASATLYEIEHKQINDKSFKVFVESVNANLRAQGNPLAEPATQAAGGYWERGVQHAAAGLHRQSMIAKGGANIIHWAEDSIPWESYISGDPGQKPRSDYLMGITAAKLGGHYTPDAVQQRGGDVYSSGVSTSRMEAQLAQLISVAGGARVGDINITTGDPDVGPAINRALFRLGA